MPQPTTSWLCPNQRTQALLEGSQRGRLSCGISSNDQRSSNRGSEYRRRDDDGLSFWSRTNHPEYALAEADQMRISGTLPGEKHDYALPDVELRGPYDNTPVATEGAARHQKRRRLV